MGGGCRFGPAARYDTAAGRIFCRLPPDVRPPLALARYRIPTARLERAQGNSVWGDVELRRVGEAHPQSERLAGRGARERTQSHFHSGAMSPSYRRRWILDGIRRRFGAQAMAIGARGTALRRYSDEALQRPQIL